MIPPAAPAHLDLVAGRWPAPATQLPHLRTVGQDAPLFGQARTERKRDGYQVVAFTDRARLFDRCCTAMSDSPKLGLGVTDLLGRSLAPGERVDEMLASEPIAHYTYLPRGGGRFPSEAHENQG
jgi:hypothetical protein